MNDTERTPLSVFHLIHILRSHPWRWLGPMLVIGALATVYAAIRPNTWAASQALIVRNEAVANREGPGQFNHADQMKASQETILEVARSRDVLRAALAAVGPEDDSASCDWPGDEDIEQIRRAMEITPPKGAEFGSTEIFYLTVKAHDRRRAVALAEAVCDQLQNRLKSIRDSKARSMEAELEKAMKLAKDDLEESTARLHNIECEVGSDLVELRILSGCTMGESSLRRMVAEIKNELRAAHGSKNANEEMLSVLKAAQGDPGMLMAAPNRLFEQQPSLRRLKDGLVDAQLETAKLRGKMLDEHPTVKAAIESEKEIGRDLHHELDIAIRGLKAEIRMDGDNIALLGRQLQDAEGRLAKLAEVRASYANLVAETDHRSGLLEQAEQDLARARASKASADAASLISRVGDPDTGARPVGPGRALIALMGIAGGMLAGFGFVLLGLDPTSSANASFPHTYVPADNRLVAETIKRNGRKIIAAGRTSISQALQKVSSL